MSVGECLLWFSHDGRYFGDLESTVDEMERSLKQDPSNASVWIQLADMKVKQRNR